ncbi:hypothetical protein ACOJQI_11220 [Bacillus salacetis]|uniref:hypothetical protein n=1 Tax=Bacillus salacetis TaxID=2315464 RepID=UPI003BA1C3E0
MFVGRALYLLGLAFVFFSIIAIIMMLFTGGEYIIPIFSLLNGLIAMGVGDIVIDVNHRQRIEKAQKDNVAP